MPLPQKQATGALIITKTYVQRRYPIGFDFGAEREQDLQAERIHDDDLRVVPVAEQKDVIPIGHMICRHAGVHLRQLGALATFAVDQVPSAHLAVLRRADQEVVVLHDRGSRQTEHGCGMTHQQTPGGHFQGLRIDLPQTNLSIVASRR